VENSDGQLSIEDIICESDQADSDDHWPIPLGEVAEGWKWTADHLHATGEQIGVLAEALDEALSSHSASKLSAVVTELGKIAEDATHNPFMSLCLETVELHHRGTGVLNPDHHSDAPKKSPFVRVIPEWEIIEAGQRIERRTHQIEAYEDHLRQAFAHFRQTWAALTWGALVCDFAMIDDEFPKLEEIIREVQKAKKLWTEAMRPWLD
jgi:pterin-4a-carbinolamine dehydratase